MNKLYYLINRKKRKMEYSDLSIFALTCSNTVAPVDQGETRLWLFQANTIGVS